MKLFAYKKNLIAGACVALTSLALLNGCGGSRYDNNFPLDSSQAPNVPGAIPPTGYNLIWADEFDSGSTATALNARVWDFDIGNNGGWGNNEQEYYTGSLNNAYLQDGYLNIVAKPDTSQSGFSYTSARVTDRPVAQSPYGYYEVRAKLPCGTGAWPAIWLLGDSPVKGSNGQYQTGNWPAEGEIDMVEWMSAYFDTNTMQATIHHPFVPGSATPVAPEGYIAGLDSATATFYGAKTQVTAACGAWHVYQLLWTHTSIHIGVDGYYYFQYVNPSPATADPVNWPFDNPAHLILNVAVGGNLGGSNINGVSTPNTVNATQMPFVMQVDYVRFYQPAS